LSELSRRGTIAQVAKAVGYTPSAISQSLAQLEREVGIVLLERDGRRVRLTPAARGLVNRTERVLAELDAAEAELEAEGEAVHGSVVIGAFPSAAVGLVVPAVRDLSERHPERAWEWG
jgi:DNA-binding transcriptional LysR family regulator